MILPTEVPDFLYIYVWTWTTCLWIQVVAGPSHVEFVKRTTFNVKPWIFKTNFVALHDHDFEKKLVQEIQLWKMSKLP